MTRKTAVETPARLALRLRREERMRVRDPDPDGNEKMLDEMIRRSIDQHGA